MNNSQRTILWIGLIVTLIFLFGDPNFRSALFNKGTQTTAANTPAPIPSTSASLSDIYSVIGKSSGIPQSAQVTLCRKPLNASYVPKPSGRDLVRTVRMRTCTELCAKQDGTLDASGSGGKDPACLFLR